MGDASHQARKSDHNVGSAVDLTHDPERFDGAIVSRLAIDDPRVTYVIFDGQIWSRAREAEGWRAYSGANPHKSHVHVSVREDARADDSPWPWASGLSGSGSGSGSGEKPTPSNKALLGTVLAVGIVGAIVREIFRRF